MRITSFLDQEVEDFEHSLDSILRNSINTPELDASSDLQGVYAQFYSDNSRIQLDPSFKSHKLWCQTRLCYFLCHRQVKCQLQRWFITFPVIQLHLNSGLLSHLTISCQFLPLIDWSEPFWFSAWHWCWCLCHFRHIVAYFSYQNCSHWHNCLLHGYDGWVTAASEVHELYTKIHVILDSSVKWVGNMSPILAFLFNSASRQHC